MRTRLFQRVAPLARVAIVAGLAATALTTVASPAAASPSGQGWDAAYSYYATNAANYQVDVPGGRIYGQAVRGRGGAFDLVMNVQKTSAGGCIGGEVTQWLTGAITASIVASGEVCNAAGTVTTTAHAVPTSDWTFTVCGNGFSSRCNYITIILRTNNQYSPFYSYAAGTGANWHYVNATQLYYAMIIGTATFSGTIDPDALGDGGRTETGTLTNSAANTCSTAQNTYDNPTVTVCNIGDKPFNGTVDTSKPSFELTNTDLITAHTVYLDIPNPT